MKKEKFIIKDILTNKKKLDRRYYLVQRFKQFVAALVLGAILGALFGCYLADGGSISIGYPNALEQPIEVKAVEVKDKYQSRGYRRCYDSIICIRDIGEELGMSNKDIITMIKIGKCESNLRENAININTNKTIDRGVFQINSIHKDISNADAFIFEKNIYYAWKMFAKQGTIPWNSSKHCWNN